MTVTLTLTFPDLAQAHRALAAMVADSEQDGSAIAAVTSKAQLANAVGVEPLPSSTPLKAGPPFSGGSDGNRSIPSSSAGGAKMGAGPTPNPGQSDADASGNHCTKEEQAVAPIRKPVSFRPHCREPQLCRSGIRDHCHTCKKAMEAQAA